MSTTATRTRPTMAMYCPVQIGAGHIFALLLIPVYRAVHLAEQALALLLLRVVIARRIMEAPVLLLAKKVKQCHTFIFDKKQR